MSVFLRTASRAHRAAGFNLIEAAIVLGIVGLIVGGIWVAASSAYNNMRLQSASSQILVIAQNAKNMFANNPDTTAMTVVQAINAGIPPLNMVSGTGTTATLISPWGTAVSLTRTNGNNYLTIVYNNLPQAACAGLLGRLSGSGSSSGIRNIMVGTTNVYNAGDPATTGPDSTISASDLAKCSSAAASNDVTVNVLTN